MLAVPGSAIAGKDGDDHLRFEAAHRTHGILEEDGTGPAVESLGQGPRVAEVIGSGEELVGALDLSCRYELTGPNQTQTDPQLRSDQILPAFAPRQRKIRGFPTKTGTYEGQQSRVFIIGVSADDQQTPVGGELDQRPFNDLQTTGGRWLERRVGQEARGWATAVEVHRAARRIVSGKRMEGDSTLVRSLGLFRDFDFQPSRPGTSGSGG